MLNHEFGSKIEFKEEFVFDFSSEASDQAPKEESIHSFVQNDANHQWLHKSKSFSKEL